MQLYEHQAAALDATKDLNKVAYYLDMGLGKTFVGSEKMHQLGAKVNLVVCQKSKIQDWLDHFFEYYPNYSTHDLTNKIDFDKFFSNFNWSNQRIGVINYDLIFRRPELRQLENFTLILDESSLIQNETAKRSKFILKMNPKNVILLSGTPTAGKYEKLWSQIHLLGWPISKDLYWKQYVDTEIIDNEGYPIRVVRGYKNVERLKSKLRQHGAIFMKSEEVFDLPEQMVIDTRISTTKEYRKFRKDCIVTVEKPFWNETLYEDNIREIEVGAELVGDTTLTKMLYERMLCGQYNKDKLTAFRNIVESTEDRLIVFYNFTEELMTLNDVACSMDRPVSIINGSQRDLMAYETKGDSITFVQYQAGAMGLNLQNANKIVYFTPPLSSELYEQSKKRIHRIGQMQTCFYYRLICKNSIEEKIYSTLAMRKDYTDKLFEEQDAQ